MTPSGPTGFASVRRRGVFLLPSSNRRFPAPMTIGKTISRYSSTRSCSISVWTSVRLPLTRMSPPGCCLSFETSPATSALVTSSSLNWSPSGPRSNWKAQPPDSEASDPPGSSITPSTVTNCDTTSLLMLTSCVVVPDGAGVPSGLGEQLGHALEEDRPAVLGAWVLLGRKVPADLVEPHLGLVVAEVGEDHGHHLVLPGGLVGDGEDQPAGGHHLAVDALPADLVAAGAGEHGRPPGATRPHVHRDRRGRHLRVTGTEPACEALGLGPGLEHQLSRRVEDTGDGDPLGLGVAAVWRPLRHGPVPSAGCLVKRQPHFGASLPGDLPWHCGSRRQARATRRRRPLTLKGWEVRLPFQVLIEAVEALLPEAPVALEPVGGVLQRCPVQPRGPRLRRASSRDQPGVLEHLEVLGDRLEAHGEGFGELVDRGLAVGEPCEDRTACRVGEGGEGAAELVDCHGAVHLLVYQPLS